MSRDELVSHEAVLEEVRRMLRTGPPSRELGHLFARLGGLPAVKPQRGPRAAVAVLVTNPHGQILLGQRASEPNRGKWGMPSGGIESGETWVEAGVRELREETGLDVTIDGARQPLVVENTGSKGSAPGFTGALILFVRGSAKGTPKGASDLVDPQWFAPNALPEPMSEVSMEALRRFWAKDARHTVAISWRNCFVNGVWFEENEFRRLVWDERVFIDPGPSPAGNAGPYLHVPGIESGVVHRVYPRSNAKLVVGSVMPVRLVSGWAWKVVTPRTP